MKLKFILIIAATGLTSFLTTYLSASVNLALKVIGNEYAVSPADLSLVASLYLLFSSLCIVPFGKISDTYGPKRTLVFGCAFFVLSNLLVIVFATDFTSLLILRSIQGVASAFLVVSNTPIISMVIPKEYRTTALGVLSGLVYFGSSAGNFLGGVLTESFGWRSIFIAAAIGGAIAFIVIRVFVPDNKVQKESSKRVDIPGIVFYGMMLICLQSGANRLTEPLGRFLLAGFGIGLGLFIWRQFKSINPIYDIKLFLSNRVFAMSNLAVFFNFMSTYGSQYLLTLYLQCNRGKSPMEAGKIILIQPLMQLFISPIAGFLADKTSPAIVSSIGMGVISVALLILAQLTDTTPFLMIYLAVVLIGIGISFFSAPNISIIMGSVPDNKKGMAAASNSIMRNLGMQTSIIVCGSAFLIQLGRIKGIPPESYGQMLIATKLCYLIFMIVCIGGMIISLIRRKKEVLQECEYEL